MHSNTRMWVYLAVIYSTFALSSTNGYVNEPCSKYGCPLAPTIHEPFVPAPPGQTPKCAKPGLTFCESLDRYPQQLIKYLIEKRSVDIDKFIRDESMDEFSALRKNPDYEEEGYDYPKPKVPSGLYPQPRPQYPTTLHYQVPLNVTSNRYLPPPNPYFSQTASISTHYTYQVRPEYQNQFFNPNQGPWLRRNSRGVSGRTFNANPLLEFALDSTSRSKRQESNSNSVSICPTRSQFVSPRAALNNQGNWMYVVNLEEQQKYSQLVKSEICMSETCDGLCSLPLGYSSKCQQQFVQKRLVALEGSGDRLYTDVFWFPHGCMCQVTLDY